MGAVHVAASNKTSLQRGNHKRVTFAYAAYQVFPRCGKQQLPHRSSPEYVINREKVRDHIERVFFFFLLTGPLAPLRLVTRLEECTSTGLLDWLSEAVVAVACFFFFFSGSCNRKEW